MRRRNCVTLELYNTICMAFSSSVSQLLKPGKHGAQQAAGERGGLKRVLVLMRALCGDVRLAK